MSYLKEKILKDGIVQSGDVLKVDSFLNHQIDPIVLKEIAKEFLAYFKNGEGEKVTNLDVFMNSNDLKLYFQISVKNEG